MRFFDEAYQVPEASGSGYRWALDTPHTCTHIAFCVWMCTIYASLFMRVYQVRAHTSVHGYAYLDDCRWLQIVCAQLRICTCAHTAVWLCPSGSELQLELYEPLRTHGCVRLSTIAHVVFARVHVCARGPLYRRAFARMYMRAHMCPHTAVTVARWCFSYVCMYVCTRTYTRARMQARVFVYRSVVYLCLGVRARPQAHIRARSLVCARARQRVGISVQVRPCARARPWCATLLREHWYIALRLLPVPYSVCMCARACLPMHAGVCVWVYISELVLRACLRRGRVRICTFLLWVCIWLRASLCAHVVTIMLVCNHVAQATAWFLVAHSQWQAPRQLAPWLGMRGAAATSLRCWKGLATSLLGARPSPAQPSWLWACLHHSASRGGAPGDQRRSWHARQSTPPGIS